MNLKHLSILSVFLFRLVSKHFAAILHSTIRTDQVPKRENTKFKIAHVGQTSNKTSTERPA